MQKIEVVMLLAHFRKWIEGDGEAKWLILNKAPIFPLFSNVNQVNFFLVKSLVVKLTVPKWATRMSTSIEFFDRAKLAKLTILGSAFKTWSLTKRQIREN